MLKIGKVADMFGVRTQTIRNWVKNENLSEFFSAHARADGQSHAEFTDSDVAVLTSIHSLTKGGEYNWQAIADRLRTGWRDTTLPERAAVVAADTNSTIQLAARTLSAERQSENTLALLQEKDTEIERLRAALERLERERDAEKEKLLREIAAIERDKSILIGELQMRVKMLEEGWRPPPKE